MRSAEYVPVTPTDPSIGAPAVAAQPEPRRGSATRWGWGIGVTLAYVLAAIVMTWPLAVRLGDSTPTGEDPLLQVWIARWVQHALITDPRHLYDANIFHPYENTLAYSDSNVPAALLAAPLYLLTGNAIAANNLLVIGTFVLAAGGLYLLIRQLTGNRAVAFLAGLAFAFLPYRYVHLWHLNQLGHAWTPWVIWALIRLIERQTWRRALLFGLLFAIQAVTSFYVAFQIAFVVGVILLVALIAEPRVRTWRFFACLAAAGALAIAIILPLALPYLAVRDAQGLERTVREAAAFQAGPIAYLRVASLNHVWRWTTAGHDSEDTLFPGGFALVGALVGLISWRRHRAIASAAILIGLVAFVVALGPTWRPDPDGNGPPLPYRFLFDHFPFFKAMRVPARFGVLVDLAIVVLAGLGAAWAWERLAPRIAPARRHLVAAGLTILLALGILIELNSAPVHLDKVELNPGVADAYRWLADQPPGAVMEFPVDAYIDPNHSRSTALAMYGATFHWKPLVQGYSGFAPRSYFESLQAFRGDLPKANGQSVRNVSHVNTRNVGVLQDLGVRYLVLHHWGYKESDWADVVRQIEATGQAEQAVDFGEVTIYQLREPAGAGTDRDVSVALFAPSLAVADHFWEPAIVVRNPTDNLGLLTVRRPLKLTTTWRDADGRQVRRDELAINLPAIVPAGDLFCTVRICPAASGVAAPPPPPGTRPVRLFPDKPGRYSVELVLTGNITLTRTLDVEVATTLPATAEDGPPLAFGGATADSTTIAPGDKLALILNWETQLPVSEDLTLFAQLIGPDGKVWGQYDAPAGWPGHYTRDWLPGERVSLPWSVPLEPDAPPGQYRLLVGMYRRTPTGVERVPLRYPNGEAPEFWVGEITVR